MMKRINRMEQRLEEVARQRRKEQTDTVVSTLTISITKKKQIVSQKMKRVLPGLVSRGMEVLERDMVTKLGGLENRLAKELVTSQSREAIGWQWLGHGCDIDG
jgi:predicted RNA-binding protein with EMAP domain